MQCYARMRIYKLYNKRNSKYLTRTNTWSSVGDVFFSRGEMETFLQVSNTPVLKNLPFCEIVEYRLIEDTRYSVLEFVSSKAKDFLISFFSAKDIVRSIRR